MSLLTATSFVLTIALLLILYLWIVKALDTRIHRAQNFDAAMKAAVMKLVRLVLLIAIVLAALVTSGIDLTTNFSTPISPFNPTRIACAPLLTKRTASLVPSPSRTMTASP